MLFTGINLVVVDQLAKFCIKNPGFGELAQPFFPPLLVLGISCSWQFPNANSFASPARATSKNRAVVTWHSFFNITKFSRNFEQI